MIYHFPSKTQEFQKTKQIWRKFVPEIPRVLRQWRDMNPVGERNTESTEENHHHHHHHHHHHQHHHHNQMAAMAPEKSRTLHNFSLPPRLTWGAQKLLRCAKLNDAVSEPSERKRRNASFRSPPPSIRGDLSSNCDDQIEVIREKLMLDLRSEVDKMRAAILGNGNHPPPPPPPPPPETPETRPWNLRTRRAACKEPLGPNYEMEVVATAMMPPPATLPATASGCSGDIERVKFSVSLCRQEIEDDFVKMMGRRPPRKPKKRPRYVQKQLDTLFPGLWLSEITADMYKVNEKPEPAK